MRIHEFKTEVWLPVPPENVFPFFADAGNLETLTPPWLKFKILTPTPITMHRGALIDYRLRLRGVPVNWRTRITDWAPPHRFVDEQLRGPYRQWIHEHTFVADRGGTLARDRVRYAVPFDFLIHSWWVRPDIEMIFRYRATELQRHFASAQATPP